MEPTDCTPAEDYTTFWAPQPNCLMSWAMVCGLRRASESTRRHAPPLKGQSALLHLWH